jgi:MFS family permease
MVQWEPNDAENPLNWSTLKKTLILGLLMMLVINSTMGTALPSNAMTAIGEEFGVSSPQKKTLPISVFMIGFMSGPVIWGPLSEQYGRRVVIVFAFVAFVLWTMACALSPNFDALIVFRFFVGVFSSAPVAVVPGIVADMHDDPRDRGRAMAWFMVVSAHKSLAKPCLESTNESIDRRHYLDLFSHPSSRASAPPLLDGGGPFGSLWPTQG